MKFSEQLRNGDSQKIKIKQSKKIMSKMRIKHLDGHSQQILMGKQSLCIRSSRKKQLMRLAVSMCHWTSKVNS